MTRKTIREAINEALRQEMERDPSVVVIGEDVAGGAGLDGEADAFGGVMGVTKGLYGRFGDGRVIDTPISETAIMGMAAGSAATGLRPVAELMFCDFMGVCFDQILNQAAKFRYMFGGKATTPWSCVRPTARGSVPPRSIRKASTACSRRYPASNASCTPTPMTPRGS